MKPDEVCGAFSPLPDISTNAQEKRKRKLGRCIQGGWVGGWVSPWWSQVWKDKFNVGVVVPRGGDVEEAGAQGLSPGVMPSLAMALRPLQLPCGLAPMRRKAWESCSPSLLRGS